MLDREGCIALNLVSGIGFVKYGALCKEFGSPSAVFGQSETALLRVPGIGEKLAHNLLAFHPETELSAELEFADRAGVRILTLYDEAYPECLRQLFDPPLCLYVRGTLPPLPDAAVAIVGSRRMSAYGARMAERLAAEAAMANFAVVSGLAFGIDTVAHTTTVKQNGITVAVLGGGLARLHPQENVPLARRIVETGGALVSEFPMNYPVSRTSFPRRNRIVAGMCAATIVVEAGLDSGAMITARLALDNGRDVYAVPGMADNPQAAGCHSLIKEGAAGLIEDFSDVVKGMELERIPRHRGEEDWFGAPENSYNPTGTGDLNDTERAVVALLDHDGELSLDALTEKLQLDTGALLGTLMTLEMKQLIVQNSGQRYAKRGASCC